MHLKRIILICILAACMILAGSLHLTQNFRPPPADPMRTIHDIWTGDFEQMVERNLIRALVPYSRTHYFLDGAQPRGLTYERLKAFEHHINAALERDILKVRVVIIPTPRDRLLPDLMAGRGDIAAGHLMVSPEWENRVAFTIPAFTDVDEIVVTGPAAPPIFTIEDLSGKTLHVRPSCSYYDSLVRLNRHFQKRRLPPATIILMSEILEDEDILEMIHAGIISISVIDSIKAGLWSQVFSDITFHHDMVLCSGGEIAWAVRKNSPMLKNQLNDFWCFHQPGTKMGNILIHKYLQNDQWISNPLGKNALERFEEAVPLFQRYANQYGFDWLMIAAMAFQESGIDQSRISPAGALGVMQVLPSTAAHFRIDIPDVHDIESNIHAGLKYLRFITDRYFDDDALDDFNAMLFAMAAYNAGPARIIRFRREAAESGLNPDIWFGNVEIIAAQRIGRETVEYVGNIYKYYLTYRLFQEKDAAKQALKRQYYDR
ncbi:MAG: lytic transglycosylase F [Desulfobacteraceae bacterium]|jgi:membrane-bound lytic murein transglycosylase MltF|nr:MAG: lytic transglycosylase F [Desulfobacteraceae bacterium]